MNTDPSFAVEYHEATKHSELSVRTSRHSMDWNNKPRAFKVYTELPSIPLPKEFPHPRLGALTAVGMTQPKTQAEGMDIATLAEIFFFSAGITRELRHPLGTSHMRAAPATGALYPTELYAICQDLPGLTAGVYHFGPGDFALTQLRAGDYRRELSSAAGGSTEIAASPVTVAFTSMAWRNAWKYEARSYRHWFWDSGVIAANLLATAASQRFTARLILGFVDARIEHLLGLEQQKEAPVALIPLGASLGSLPPKTPPPVPLIKPQVLPLSDSEAEHPDIWRIHEASRLHDEEEVQTWVKTARALQHQRRPAAGLRHKLEPLAIEPAEEPSLSDVILRRGSTRRFALKAISLPQLSSILRCSTRGVPIDVFGEEEESLIESYVLVNAVDGLPSGAYYLNHEADSLEQVKSGEFRRVSGYLCLEQPLLAQASTVIFLMADLKQVLGSWGNRGYRLAQFEAGVVAGKIYLTAYALSLGATGTTFYDDAVTEFFSPHTQSKSPMMAVGVGVPDYRARPGRILTGVLTREQMVDATS